MNYFNFNGVDSADMGLYVAYFDKEVPTTGAAGGKYELAIDTLPTNPKQIYYGKNYSTQPLEYTADFLLETIPDNSEEDYTELWDDINDWLFGADGYKKFYMSNSTDYNYLTCVMIPVENLFIKGKQIGVRVLIHNNSPFWYNDKTITFDFTGKTADENGDVLFTKNIASASGLKVYPIIKFKPNTVSGGSADYFLFRIQNIVNGVIQSEFRTYLRKNETDKEFVIDCENLTIKRDGEIIAISLRNSGVNTSIVYPDKDWFYLNAGANTIKVNVLDLQGNPAPLQYLKMDYTKFIRKGEIVV